MSDTNKTINDQVSLPKIDENAEVKHDLKRNPYAYMMEPLKSVSKLAFNSALFIVSSNFSSLLQGFVNELYYKTPIDDFMFGQNFKNTRILNGTHYFVHTMFIYISNKIVYEMINKPLSVYYGLKPKDIKRKIIDNNDIKSIHFKVLTKNLLASLTSSIIQVEVLSRIYSIGIELLYFKDIRISQRIKNNLKNKRNYSHLHYTKFRKFSFYCDIFLNYGLFYGIFDSVNQLTQYNINNTFSRNFFLGYILSATFKYITHSIHIARNKLFLNLICYNRPEFTNENLSEFDLNLKSIRNLKKDLVEVCGKKGWRLNKISYCMQSFLPALTVSIYEKYKY